MGEHRSPTRRQCRVLHVINSIRSVAHYTGVGCLLIGQELDPTCEERTREAQRLSCRYLSFDLQQDTVYLVPFSELPANVFRGSRYSDYFDFRWSQQCIPMLRRGENDNGVKQLTPFRV